MKLTKSKLKQLIEEELYIVLDEGRGARLAKKLVGKMPPHRSKEDLRKLFYQERTPPTPLPGQSKGHWIPVKEVVQTLKNLEKLNWVLDGQVESLAPENDPRGAPNEFFLPLETTQRSSSEPDPDEFHGFIQTVEEHVVENKFNVANLTKFRGPPLDDETRLQAGKIFGRSDDNGPTQFILALGKR